MLVKKRQFRTPEFSADQHGISNGVSPHFIEAGQKYIPAQRKSTFLDNLCCGVHWRACFAMALRIFALD
jgi:hypothetical protein